MNTRIAVLMPTYVGSAVLPRTLDSLVEQTYVDFCIYVNDDTPPEFQAERDRLLKVLSLYENRLQFDVKLNETNLGYPKNLISLFERTSENYIFLCAQDDVLSPVAIESCYRALEENEGAIAVSRPYFWFDKDINRPIRRIRALGMTKPIVITAESQWRNVKAALVASSQLTGLMYRRALMREHFANSVFPAHIYPIAGAIRDGGLVFLPFSTVAVSVAQSQTRTLATIYSESPSLAWAQMYNSIFEGRKFKKLRNFGLRDHIGKNFVGLIQIRCFGSLRYFLREAVVMLRMRPLNFVDPRFHISVLGLGLLPRVVSRFIVEQFKERLIARKIRGEALAQVTNVWWK